MRTEIGGKLLPVMTTLASTVLDAINFTERHKNVIIPLAAAVGTLTIAVVAVNAATAAGTAITAGAAAVKGFFVATTNADTGATVVSTVARIGNTAATVAAAVAMGIARAAVAAWSAAQWLLNAALSRLVIVALAALAAGLVIAWKHSETFRAIVKGAFAGVLLGVSALLFGVEKLLGALGKVPGFGWAKDSARAVHGARDRVDDLRRSIDGVPTYKRVTIDVVTNGVNTAAGAIAKLEGGDAKFQGRALGGPIAAGVPYIVGEQGPELIVPGSSGHVMTASQTAAITRDSSGGSDPVLHAKFDAMIASNVRLERAFLEETDRRVRLVRQGALA